MSARKISFRVSGETARAMEHLAKGTHLSAADIASDALEFHVRLPDADYHAIQSIRRFGTDDDFARLMDRVSRVIQHTWYEVAVHRVRLGLSVGGSDMQESVDDALALVNRASKSPPALPDLP